MYSKRFILDVLDERHKSLSGGDNASSILNVPFGTEYKVFLKNDNDFDCAVDIVVDGIRPLGYDKGKPNFLILPAHQKYLLEGWFNQNLRGGDRFKIVALDSPEAKSSGRVKNDSDNGVIEATFYPASKRDPYISLREDWERRLRDHEKLRREYSSLQEEIERLRILQKIRELEEEIERHKRYDRWSPWREPWIPRYPKYEPVWVTTTGGFSGFSPQRRSVRKTNSLNESSGGYQEFSRTMNISMASTDSDPSSKPLMFDSASLNIPQSSASLYSANIDQYETQEAATERGSRHYDSLDKVDYEVGEEVLAKLRIKLMGFHAPEAPVVTAKSKNDSPEQTPTNARFCTKCGHKLGNHNFRFCPMCGNVISS